MADDPGNFQSRHDCDTIDDALDVALTLQQGTAPASYQTAPVPYPDFPNAQLDVDKTGEILGAIGFDFDAWLDVYAGTAAYLRSDDDGAAVSIMSADTFEVVSGNVPASGVYDLILFGGSRATGDGAHAEGAITRAEGKSSHTEGIDTTASGEASHAEGSGTIASGGHSHAEGGGSASDGRYSHAEGHGSQSLGEASHAEGKDTAALGDYTHVEGEGAQAEAAHTHAGGKDGYARLTASMARGAFAPSDGAFTPQSIAGILACTTTSTAPKNLHAGDVDGETPAARLYLPPFSVLRISGSLVVHERGSNVYGTGSFSLTVTRAGYAAPVLAHSNVTWDNAHAQGTIAFNVNDLGANGMFEHVQIRATGSNANERDWYAQFTGLLANKRGV